MDIGSAPVITSTELAIPQYRNEQARQVVPVYRDQRAPAEQVLQGEFLQHERPGTDNRIFDTREFHGSRREDHPGFRQRHSNEAYAGRRAVSAYQDNEDVSASGRSGSHLNIFA
jgi:hypothetical protein